MTIQELGLELLKSRRWYKRLCCMFKLMNEKAPNYLKNLIPKCRQTVRTRTNHIPSFNCRTECFKNSFFPSTLSDWFNLDISVRKLESIDVFKSRLLSFIRPIENNVYNIFDPVGLKFLTRLRLGFSHLNKHRFQHNFQDCINPLCSCSLDIEDTIHYLLHCHHFSQHRIDLMNSVNSIYRNFSSLSDNNKRDVLLFGDPSSDGNTNKFILEATLLYIKKTERFSGSLFD